MKKVVISLLVIMAVTSLSVIFVRKSKKTTKDVRLVEVLDKKVRKQNKEKELYEKAIAYIDANEVKEAVPVWKELIRDFPGSKFLPRAYYELGQYYLNNGKEKTAVGYFEKSCKLFPQAEYTGYSYFALAGLDEKNKKFDDALLKYKKVKDEFFFIDVVADAVSKIADINMKQLFSRQKNSDSFIYEIKPGDTIFGIAKKFNNTIDYILDANALGPKGVIHPGKRIKVLNPDVTFTVYVDKSQKRLTLKKKGDIIKYYGIAIGKNDSTPVGTFKVQNKLKDPVWFNAGQAIPANDPKNILGSRWIGFDNDLGLHGTTEDKEITKQETSGCVRMYNEDIEQLFKLLRVGDRIIIQE